MKVKALKIYNDKIIQKVFNFDRDDLTYKQIQLAIEESIRDKTVCFSKDQQEIQLGLSLDTLLYGGVSVKDIMICSRVFEKAGPFPFLLLEDEDFDANTYFEDFGKLQYFDYKGIIFPAEQEKLFLLFIIVQTLKNLFGFKSLFENEDVWICNDEDNTLAEAIALFELMCRINNFKVSNTQKDFVAFYNSCFLESPEVTCSITPYTQLYSDDHSLLLSIQIEKEKIEQIAKRKQMEVFISPGLALFLDNVASYLEYENIVKRYQNVELSLKEITYTWETNLVNSISEQNIQDKLEEELDKVRYEILEQSRNLFKDRDKKAEALKSTTAEVKEPEDGEIRKICAFLNFESTKEIVQPMRDNWSCAFQYLQMDKVSLTDWDFSKVKFMSEMFISAEIKRFSMSYCKPKRLITIHGMFKDCKQLEFVDFTSVDFTSCKDFTDVFNGCEKLLFVNLKNTKFPTEISIKGMFKNCKELYKKYATTDDYEILRNLILESNSN